MRNKVLSSLFTVILFNFLFIAIPLPLFAQESITITTYYPSPYGTYNDLTVMDKLGIGTATPPTASLDVVGTVSILRTPTSMILGTVYTADTDLLFMCNLAGGSFTYIRCVTGDGVQLYSQNPNITVNQAGCSLFARKGETYFCAGDGSGYSFTSRVYKLGK